MVPRPKPLPREDALLSRTEFRERVFQRDGSVCVVCHAPAVDAHHIEPRKAFSDGGYYLGNGVSLCGPDHVRAESGELSKAQLRQRAGIRRVILPA